MLNQQIGPYKIISELGEGGMAMVYLAEKGNLGKKVALKVLKKEFLYNQNILGRFLSEAKKMINLKHPNIVGVQDLIDEPDFVAIELEYIEGVTLKQYLNEKGALPDDEIEVLFKQMLDAVGYVHDKGYVHRDIKPSNFMLTQNGTIKLTDFGIAKNSDDSNIDYTGTGTGMQMGTPKYMSPEQVRSTKDVDHRSDIYSLGVVLWEMVTGKVPYDIVTESTFDVFRKIVDEPLEKTNTKWDGVILKASEKNSDNRYQSIRDISLDNFVIKVNPRKVSKPSYYAAIILGVIILILLVLNVYFKINEGNHSTQILFEDTNNLLLDSSELRIVHPAEEEQMNDRLKELDLDSSFDLFYEKFVIDKNFRNSRIKFPIDGSNVFGYDENDVLYWTKQNWDKFGGVTHISEIDQDRYTVDIERSENIVTHHYYIDQSGFSITYRYKKIENKWFLVFFEVIDV